MPPRHEIVVVSLQYDVSYYVCSNLSSDISIIQILFEFFESKHPTVFEVDVSAFDTMTTACIADACQILDAGIMSIQRRSLATLNTCTLRRGISVFTSIVVVPCSSVVIPCYGMTEIKRCES